MYGAGTPVTDESDDEHDRDYAVSDAAGGQQHTTPGSTSQRTHISSPAGASSTSADAAGATNSYGVGGGFTETVLDEADDGDDVEESGNNWISIDYEGKSFQVVLTEQIRTFGDVKQHLLASNIALTSTHYIVDPETDQEYQDEDDASIVNHRQLVIRWHCFFVKIVDGMDFRQDVRVSEDFTIAKIKEQVESEWNVRLEQLSKDGYELENDKTLREYNIVDNGHSLISRIAVQVIDEECSLSTDILICEFWSLRDVLDTYLSSSRRERHERAMLHLNDRSLDLSSTVFDEQIENQVVLKYVVGSYRVLVYDSEMTAQNAYLQGTGLNASGTDQQCVEVQVADNQSIVDIQTEYARITRKPFMANDKLISNERVLEENVPLFKLRIKDNEALIIEREQQQKAAEYICAECGAIVSLRPFDAVQCRECFMNVVYKKRTTRVCQYNCR